MQVSTPKSQLVRLSHALGYPVKDLLVLAPQNDPFNSGTEGDVAKAEWFAKMFSLFGGKGDHLRRIHYRIISNRIPVLRPDGAQYLNTEKDWKFLSTASRHARFLGYISPQDLVDQRNPDPKLFAPQPCGTPSIGWSIDEFDGFSLPSISTWLRAYIDLPSILVHGYNYSPGEQPYYLEVWVEKSTMDTELTPLCQKHGVNLVTSAGFQSITNAVQCLSRVPTAASMRRPVRIFYISDFDPAGVQMPVAVSRQIEFWLRELRVEADLKLTPIALTRQQIVDFDLPRIPVKDEDLRKASFEAIHGEGAVELDALEALHPGSLANIVEEHILRYRDTEMQARCTEAGEEAESEAQDAWDAFTSELQATAEELDEQAEAVIDTFMPELQELKTRLDAALEPIKVRLEALEAEVRGAIRASGEQLDLELPERPVPEIERPDESTWLFDSSRSFEAQLDIYTRHQQGEFNA